MKYIKLTNGKYTIVDNEDYNWLNSWKWYDNRGRAARTSSFVLMSRLILNAPSEMVVDHINGDTLDNRKSNLRLCTISQNAMNSKHRIGLSKYKGVSWYSRTHRWLAGIRVNGKTIHLGYYDFEEQAALAYNTKAIELFGEYARLNKVGGGMNQQ